MLLDLTSLVAHLKINDEYLIDGGYLEPDIKILYDHFKDSKDIPPEIQRYFETHDGFEFLEFLRSYIKASTHFTVNFSYTEDGWLIISNDNGN